jgi:hypothetical protein
MDNLHVRLNFNLSKEKGNTAKKNIMKLVNCKIWLRNVVKLGKYSLAKFVYVCIIRAEIVRIFGSKMVTISARNTNIYKICKLRKAIYFRILQHFVTKFCSFTNFNLSSLREFTFFCLDQKLV